MGAGVGQIADGRYGEGRAARRGWRYGGGDSRFAAGVGRRDGVECGAMDWSVVVVVVDTVSGDHGDL